MSDWISLDMDGSVCRRGDMLQSLPPGLVQATLQRRSRRWHGGASQCLVKCSESTTIEVQHDCTNMDVLTAWHRAPEKSAGAGCRPPAVRRQAHS